MKPQARFRLRDEERFEVNNNASGLELAAQASIYPRVEPSIEFGLEIGTAGTELDSQPESVSLSGGSTNKSLALSQAYAAFDIYKDDKNSFLISAGKFYMPFRSSPMTWDMDRRPEGLYESYELKSVDLNWRLRVHATQISTDRVAPSAVNGTDLRRSWLFLQGFDLSYRSLTWIRVNLGSQYFHYYDLSERLQEISSHRGNNLKNPSILNQLESKFGTWENFFELSSHQFGILTAFRTSAILNILNDDLERGLFAEVEVGDSWKRGFFQSKASFVYVEPNAGLAFFSDNEWGYNNRKAAKLSLNYFPMDQLKLGSSLLIANTIQSSAFQRDQKQVLAEMEYRF